MTLNELKSKNIMGNAYHDQHIFNDVDSFVHDPNNSIGDKAEALRWMTTEVMGAEDDFNQYDSAEQYVQEYLDGC